MKKTNLLAIILLFISANQIFAQNNQKIKHESVKYHFFTNNIPSDWNYPLIGFVNNVDGNHASVQIGLVNSTTGNFGGLQSGVINSVGGNVTGIQSGFINSIGGNVNGIQSGLINSTSADFSGLQYGFVNSVGNSFYGIQSGFINSSSSITGIQAGFINSAQATVKGVQCGFINSAEEIRGVQHGFINSAKSLLGLQLGFINSVDKVEKGLPIGLLSFVKNGGYKSIEVSYNNINPLSIAFKTGVRKFYTYPKLAYDWRLADDRLSFGYGIGSIYDIGKLFFINPEIESLHQISLDFNHYSNVIMNLGLNIGDNIEIMAGPSLIWHFKINADDLHHNYTEWDPSIVAINKLKVGFNVAVRYKF